MSSSTNTTTTPTPPRPPHPTRPSWIGPPPSRPTFTAAESIMSAPRAIDIRYAAPGLQPPVFVCSSLSEPPWELREMVALRVGDGESGEKSGEKDGEKTLEKSGEKAAGNEPTTDRAPIDPHVNWTFSSRFPAVLPGEYQYKFRLGRGEWWVCDPHAPVVDDGCGNTNNLLVVESTPSTLSGKREASATRNDSLLVSRDSSAGKEVVAGVSSHLEGKEEGQISAATRVEREAVLSTSRDDQDKRTSALGKELDVPSAEDAASLAKHEPRSPSSQEGQREHELAPLFRHETLSQEQHVEHEHAPLFRHESLSPPSSHQGEQQVEQAPMSPSPKQDRREEDHAPLFRHESLSPSLHQGEQQNEQASMSPSPKQDRREEDHLPLSRPESLSPLSLSRQGEQQNEQASVPPLPKQDRREEDHAPLSRHESLSPPSRQGEQQVEQTSVSPSAKQDRREEDHAPLFRHESLSPLSRQADQQVEQASMSPSSRQEKHRHDRASHSPASHPREREQEQARLHYHKSLSPPPNQYEREDEHAPLLRHESLSPSSPNSKCDEQLAPLFRHESLTRSSLEEDHPHDLETALPSPPQDTPHGPRTAPAVDKPNAHNAPHEPSATAIPARVHFTPPCVPEAGPADSAPFSPASQAISESSSSLSSIHEDDEAEPAAVHAPVPSVVVVDAGDEADKSDPEEKIYAGTPTSSATYFLQALEQRLGGRKLLM